MMARPKQFVSKAQIAKTLKLSRGRISQLIQLGMPVRQDGLVNEAEAVEWHRQHVRRRANPTGAQPTTDGRTSAAEVKPANTDDTAPEPVAGGTGESEPGASPDYWTHRARLICTQADQAAFNLGRDRARYCETAAITAQWCEILVKIRDNVLSLPSRIVGRLPGELQKEFWLVVKEECRKTMVTISDELNKEQFRLISLKDKYEKDLTR
jgi:phage terminase Nu1 subunit (DNA packaging protein)